MTSRFKVGTAGCCGRGGFSGVFPTIFVLYLNYLPSEALYSTSSISYL